MIETIIFLTEDEQVTDDERHRAQLSSQSRDLTLQSLTKVRTYSRTGSRKFD